ncbi:hypothetical protein Zmor_013188 [Zophobas morio]|uniref:Limulus clotting factor C n=1 Tax=Zophobas morio TaxID=2755281 RepID=A0AA38IHY2_9CUCU|nr:hypothetical protein Zmor_013188 [Zophobas morio]
MWRVKQFVIQVIILCVVVGTTSGTQHINSRYARAFYQGLDTRCTLPPHPAFGKWTIFDDSSDLSPGQLVSSRTVLEINCDENYNLDGEDTSVCLRGKWKPSIGRCLRTCPPINSTLAMTVTCTYNDKELTPCTGALEGTIARFRCADFYEDQGLESQPLRICAKGAWGSNLPKCVPRCGKPASARLATLIIGGTVVERGQYPWQVAIYMKRNKELICGGTLLNQRVISTAAHCITGTTGKLQPKEDFIVAVGKYYRQFDHHEETAQFSSVCLDTFMFY